jgi:hypothetical protein
MYFTVGKSNFDSVAHKLTSVTPALLEHLAVKLEQECKLTNPSPEEHNDLQLLQQVNTLSTRIPGSQASKIFVRNEIQNYYGYFSLPHIFFTFNPSPMHSPIFQVMFGDKMVDLSSHFPVMPSVQERALRLAQDPVAAADFFEFSFRVLFHYLLGWDFESGCSVATGGIFGFIQAFYGTSEFTECGSLHGHFLIWLEGGLNPSDIHDHLRESTEYQHCFFAFSSRSSNITCLTRKISLTLTLNHVYSVLPVPQVLMHHWKSCSSGRPYLSLKSNEVVRFYNVIGAVLSVISMEMTIAVAFCFHMRLLKLQCSIQKLIRLY